ncbi:MAG: deoxyribonuclease IV [Candidatus Dadabacteria bacterium]|nr:deoxyribonuclease IV [Candidatus Dadabacteria bacterium]
MKIGAHVSIAGGIDKAPKRAKECGCECFQIFTRSPRGGKAPELEPQTVKRFWSECGKYGMADYYIHIPYYLNLASVDSDIYASSLLLVAEELDRADAIRAKYVVLHPGSAGNLDVKEGIRRVVDGLRSVYDGREAWSSKLLVENTAGQGKVIGHRFEELAEIIEGVKSPELGVCLDTAHLFASGYDMRNPKKLEKVLDEFDSIVGIERLRLIHANDSKVGLGERKDRHEHIGKGMIGLDAFRGLLRTPRLGGIDVIVETTPERVGEDINTLRRLRVT